MKMSDFTLDPRLAKDCLVLGKLNFSQLLLMNNSLVPWFILVPNTSEVEIIDLSKSEQADLQEEINRLSAFVRNNFVVSKLNIAAIGNVVSQLHIHVVGRDPADYCWPNVVWGRDECRPYSDEKVVEIRAAVREQLGVFQ
ncbi:Histidine triad family protein [hydrothermal vent metagenome]|uniref:Histidine triad family protein n=1 Tax=hydrothermal vent metagenome TaxID=652676 RepID=A0A3B1BAT0_9ZZZZ